MNTHAFSGFRRATFRVGRRLREAIACNLLMIRLSGLRDSANKALAETVSAVLELVVRQQRLTLDEMASSCSEPAVAGFSRHTTRLGVILKHIWDRIGICSGALEQENASASAAAAKVRSLLATCQVEWNPHRAIALWRAVLTAIRLRVEELERLTALCRAEASKSKDLVDREGALAERNLAAIAPPPVAINRRRSAAVGLLIMAVAGCTFALGGQLALVPALILTLLLSVIGAVAGWLINRPDPLQTVIDPRVERIWTVTRDATTAYAEAAARQNWYNKRTEFWRLIHEELSVQFDLLPEKAVSENLNALEAGLRRWWEDVPPGRFVTLPGTTEIYGRDIAAEMTSTMAVDPGDLDDMLKTWCGIDDPDIQSILVRTSNGVFELTLENVVGQLEVPGRDASLSDELTMLYGYCASALTTRPGKDIDRQLTPEVMYIGMVDGHANPLANLLATKLNKPAFYAISDADAIEIICTKQNIDVQQLGVLERYADAYNQTSPAERAKLFAFPGITIDGEGNQADNVLANSGFTSTWRVSGADGAAEVGVEDIPNSAHVLLSDSSTDTSGGFAADVVSALRNLEYSRSASEKAVKAVAGWEALPFDQLLKQSLQVLKGCAVLD